MLASKNLPQPITKASEGHHWIRVLAAELALRLKDAREANPNLWPKTLVLHARKGQELQVINVPHLIDSCISQATRHLDLNRRPFPSIETSM